MPKILQMKNYQISIIKTIVFCGFFMWQLAAKSFVQLETGQVFHEMIDFELTNGKFPLVILRQYQQTKSGISILGDRWCLDFEQQIRAEGGGYRLYLCGNPTLVFFELKGKRLVFGNEELFEKEKGGFLRRGSKQTTYIYNEKGLLVAKKRTGTQKASIKIGYDRDNKPIKISYLDKYLLEIKLDAKGKATGIFSGPKKVVNYVVLNDKLVVEKNGWGLEHKFEYNAMGLLTQIQYPDNTTEKFAYNNQTKTIEDFISKDGCVRKFNYNLDTARTTANISIKDSCVKEPPLQIALKKSPIFHKNRAAIQAERVKPLKIPGVAISRDQFNRVQKIENSQFSWTINYNVKTGEMISFAENDKKSKANKIYQVVYRYNKLIEISEIGRSKVKFDYSPKGKLLRVRSTAKPQERLLMMTKIDQIRAIIGDATL